MDLTSVYKYLKEGYREGRAGSFQWCPEPGQEAVVTDYTPTLFHVFSFLWAFFISFFLYHRMWINKCKILECYLYYCVLSVCSHWKLGFK